jgi:muramoyltetrapeptide carboxypeptidase
MAHLYIYSPSGAVRDKAALARAVKRLRALGHQVELDAGALASWQRFAGDDAARLAAIARAAASGADAALITRGGYGLTRLLPALPYKAIARAIERGTQFIGFSDFTALQLAVLARGGGVTWAGPALIEGFGAEGAGQPDESTRACFQDLLDGSAEGAGWRLPAGDIAALAGRRGGHLARGATLWGGNLTMVASLLGTPWWPAAAGQGGILFLEDAGEHPYRIERMLAQLLHAGVLARQKAIVLGRFTGYQLAPHDRGYSLAKVVDWLRGQIRKVPVLTGLPFGHAPTKVLLPVGAKIDLLVEGREALALWGHLPPRGMAHQ